MRILFASPEIHPYAKTGGLADVSNALPTSIRKMGNDVRCVMPHYRCVGNIGEYVCNFYVEIKGRKETIVVRRVINDFILYLIGNYHYYDRDEIYGYDDDSERFMLFNKSVIKLLDYLDWFPDIIHCNDWQSGFIPLLAKIKSESDKRFEHVRTLFTIHNVGYQGNFNPEELDGLGIPWDYFNMHGFEYFGKVSFMKSGIVFSDAVNTVSQKYAEEIQTDEFGEGMQVVLINFRDKIYGIRNGIDEKIWNPASDKFIYAKYSMKNLARKKLNKEGLQKELGLEKKDIPLIGMITRIASQKGMDILIDIIKDGMKRYQLVILGVGEKKYEDIIREISSYDSNVVFLNYFSEEMAHKIYAGSDMFLMPSRYEPCGLGQMIAMKYGSVPIVRGVGGLYETVKDVDEHPDGNGFVFKEYSSEAMNKCIDKAILYFRNKKRWREIIKKGMTSDFSWKKAASEYLNLYKRMKRCDHER